jgi:hypothetical protein
MHVVLLYWQTTQRPCITSYRFLLVVRRVWEINDEAGWTHVVSLMPANDAEALYRVKEFSLMKMGRRAYTASLAGLSVYSLGWP